MIELDWIDGYPIAPTEEKKTCPHWWVQYRGIIEVFNYCDKCGIKEGDENEDNKGNSNVQDSSG